MAQSVSLLTSDGVVLLCECATKRCRCWPASVCPLQPAARLLPQLATLLVLLMACAAPSAALSHNGLNSSNWCRGLGSSSRQQGVLS